MIPFWGTLKTRCRMIFQAPKGNIILTATHTKAPRKTKVGANRAQSSLVLQLQQGSGGGLGVPAVVIASWKGPGASLPPP